MNYFKKKVKISLTLGKCGRSELMLLVALVLIASKVSYFIGTTLLGITTLNVMTFSIVINET
jgi:hypothetical protein